MNDPLCFAAIATVATVAPRHDMNTTCEIPGKPYHLRPVQAWLEIVPDVFRSKNAHLLCFQQPHQRVYPTPPFYLDREALTSTLERRPTRANPAEAQPLATSSRDHRCVPAWSECPQ